MHTRRKNKNSKAKLTRCSRTHTRTHLKLTNERTCKQASKTRRQAQRTTAKWEWTNAVKYIIDKCICVTVCVSIFDNVNEKNSNHTPFGFWAMADGIDITYRPYYMLYPEPNARIFNQTIRVKLFVFHREGEGERGWKLQWNVLRNGGGWNEGADLWKNT